MREAIDHLDLVVSDFDRSLRFYTELLRPLGYLRHSDIEGERGERVTYVGRLSGSGEIGIREAQSGSTAPYDRYAVGVHHLAFAAPDRETVDERARWLRDQGAEVESGPKEHAYAPGYYAVFFFDPDGIKLEIVHMPQERDLAARVQELEARLAALEG